MCGRVFRIQGAGGVAQVDRAAGSREDIREGQDKGALGDP